MGWGGDLVILDESCLITEEVYRSKISRMLGDNPDSMLVEIGNPWNRLNQMWKHWNDPIFTKFHIPYTLSFSKTYTNNTNPNLYYKAYNAQTNHTLQDHHNHQNLSFSTS